jgi:HEAT repeat protein
MRAIEEHSQRLAALDSLPDGPAREGLILAALEDESVVVRERAIRLAARHIEPQTLGELVADESNAIRRNAAISALERQGPYAVPHLRTMLVRPETDVIMFALQMLSRIGDPLAVHGIVPLVRHSDPNVAQCAIEALGQLRHREAVPTLLQLLGEDLWLQLAAIEALGQIGDPKAIAPLAALVPDSIVAEPAVTALQRIAAPESLEILLGKLLVVSDTSLRDALLLTLGVIIDLHPDPAPIAARFSGTFGGSAELSAYLDEVLRWDSSAPATAQASANNRDLPGLVRAATALTVVAGLQAQYPAVLTRIATDEDPAWAIGLFRRHPAALPALRALLRHKDLLVRRGTLLTGAFEAADLEFVVEHLADPDAMVRAAACRALGQIAQPSTVPLLVRHLCEGDDSERAAAVQALAEFPPEALQPLEQCLAADAPEPIVHAALEILSRRCVPQFEPRIAEFARHPSPAIRKLAVRAAAQLPGTKAEVVLLRALADRHQPIQVEALDLLVKRDHDRILPTLAALLEAGDSLRCHVIRALGQMRALEVTPRLERLYSQCGPHEQIEIVLAMGRIGGPKVAEFLRARLHDSTTEIRRVAARGLARMVDASHLPLLVHLAADADWSIRQEAARGLGRLQMAECQPTLLTLVRDVEPAVANTAREILAGFRRAGPAAA